MWSTVAFVVAALAPLAYAQNSETVLGVYMFHRHGDRTAKMTPPANLTDLGYLQVFTSGQWYRNRYIASNATARINGVNSDIVKQSQIAVSAPDDTVLQNSAMGFLQGLYPPVGDAMGSAILRDGTNVTSPLNGYQLIPVDLVSSGSGSEDNSWLQSTSNCAAATISSNNFFSSMQYTSLLNSTHDFYQNILPVINGTFNPSTDTFKNAYTIFDLINVAQIHNTTNYNSSSLITPDVFYQLRTLADAHEWGLAYNSTDTARAIAGKTLAAQIVQFLNGTITGKGKQKIGVQFGAYGTFSSFFGLADLPAVNVNFTGVADYASAMTFEMFTNATTAVSTTSYPSNDDIYVRFWFHNGTTNDNSPPMQYPLFGSNMPELGWNDFVNGMNKFAVGTTQEWCTSCQNFTGTCAAYASNASSSSNSAEAGSGSGSGNGLSPAVNGVIGAMVTLAVILGLEAFILLAGGFKIVNKKRLMGSPATSVTEGGAKA